MEHSLHFPGHTLFSIAVVSLLSLSGFVLYLWRIKGALSRRDRFLLLGLRLAALAAILGAYFQPTDRTEEVIRRKSITLVLVDDSASMGAVSDNATRAEHVAAFFQERDGWFSRIEKAHEVRYFSFSDRARPASRDALTIPLPSEGGTTDIAGAIREAARDLNPRDIGGVIVFSDGIDTRDAAAETPRGSEPARRTLPAAFPGPVYGIVPDQKDPPKNVALSRVRGLDIVICRDLAEVHGEIRAVGYTEGRVVVALSEEGRVLDWAEVTLTGTTEPNPFGLSFLPREPGRHIYQVSVSALPDEAWLADNSRAMVVDVVRDRIRVLHVAGHPSWDERFLREYLRERRDVELVSFHTLRPPDSPVTTPDDETTLIPFPANEIFVNRIEGFDLVVLQDFDLPEPDRDRLVEGLQGFVREGGSILWIGGSFTFGSRGPWPSILDPVLPVTAPKSSGHGMVEGRAIVEVPADAAQHPILADSRLIEHFSRGPALAAYNRVGGPAAGGQVLLRALPEVTAETGVRVPVLVTAQRGSGLVAALLTDTLWRWAFDPDRAGLYRRFLDRLTGYLTRDPELSPIRIRAGAARVSPGQVQRLTVSAPPGTARATVSVRRTGADPAPVETAEVELGADGRGEHRVVPGTRGAWKVTVTAGIGGATREASDVFVVGPSPEETARFVPATGALAALASQTGGHVATLSKPDLDRIALRPDVVARVGIVSDDPEWNHPAVFFFLLIALGLEWFIERKIGYT
jgi:hypothetical protein